MGIFNKIASGIFSAIRGISKAIGGEKTKEKVNEPRKNTEITKKTDENTLAECDFDGKIDNTKQGNVGDCWLLAGVNALNSTDKGKELIKNALEYDDYMVTVHLATGDYKYSKIWLGVARDSSSSSSSGDADMSAIEYAISDAIKDLKKGDVTIKDGEKNSKRLKEYIDLYKQGSTGGDPEFLFLLLAGKDAKSSSFFINKAFSIFNLYKDKKSNKNNIAAVASCFEDKKVKDAKGNTVSITGDHAYSVKKTNLKTVTIVNPADSSKEIVLPTLTFLSTFQRLTTVDLSSENVGKDYFSRNDE